MKILKNFFLNIYFTKKKTKSPNKKTTTTQLLSGYLYPLNLYWNVNKGLGLAF